MNIDRLSWIRGLLTVIMRHTSNQEWRQLQAIYLAIYGVDTQTAIENIYQLMVEERAQNDMADTAYLLILSGVLDAVRKEYRPKSPKELALRAVYGWLRAGGKAFAVIKAQEELAGLYQQVVTGASNLTEAYGSTSLDMRLVFSSFVQQYEERRATKGDATRIPS